MTATASTRFWACLELCDAVLREVAADIPLAERAATIVQLRICNMWKLCIDNICAEEVYLDLTGGLRSPFNLERIERDAGFASSMRVLFAIGAFGYEEGRRERAVMGRFCRALNGLTNLRRLVLCETMEGIAAIVVPPETSRFSPWRSLQHLQLDYSVADRSFARLLGQMQGLVSLKLLGHHNVASAKADKLEPVTMPQLRHLEVRPFDGFSSREEAEMITWLVSGVVDTLEVLVLRYFWSAALEFAMPRFCMPSLKQMSLLEMELEYPDDEDDDDEEFDGLQFNNLAAYPPPRDLLLLEATARLSFSKDFAAAICSMSERSASFAFGYTALRNPDALASDDLLDLAIPMFETAHVTWSVTVVDSEKKTSDRTAHLRQLSAARQLVDTQRTFVAVAHGSEVSSI